MNVPAGRREGVKCSHDLGGTDPLLFYSYYPPACPNGCYDGHDTTLNGIGPLLEKLHDDGTAKS